MRTVGFNDGMSGRGGRRGPIVALSIATLVIVPWAIIDAVGGADEAPPDLAVTNDSTTSAAASATTSTTIAPSEESVDADEFSQVALAASWLPRGTSRYSETDDQTQSRMRRQRLGQVAAAPASPEAPSDGVTTTVPTKQTTEPQATTTISKKQEAATSQPRETQPPVTQAPSTSAPATQPPPTAPPATDPPAPPPPPDPPAAAAPSAAEAQA